MRPLDYVAISGLVVSVVYLLVANYRCRHATSSGYRSKAVRLSVRARDCWYFRIFDFPPAIPKIAEENYTRGKRNVFCHISGFRAGDDDVLPAFSSAMLVRGILSIRRRIHAVVAAKVSQTKAANRRFNRCLIPARIEAE